MWRYRAFKAVQSIVERLPRPWAYALAVMAARFAFWFSPLALPRLEYNLSIAFPEMSRRELRRTSWLNFRNHGKAYADLMMLPRTRVTAMRPLLKVSGMENLEAARALGKGVLASNAQLVERAVKIVELLGARVLSSSETRAQLGLRAA